MEYKIRLIEKIDTNIYSNQVSKEKIEKIIISLKQLSFWNKINLIKDTRYSYDGFIFYLRQNKLYRDYIQEYNTQDNLLIESYQRKTYPSNEFPGLLEYDQVLSDWMLIFQYYDSNEKIKVICHRIDRKFYNLEIEYSFKNNEKLNQILKALSLLDKTLQLPKQHDQKSRY